MAEPKQIIRHLRACYEADNREASIFNLKDRKVAHLNFPRKGGEFLRGNLDVVPLDLDLGIGIKKTAQLNKREKTLMFGAFMIVGKPPRTRQRGPTRLFAPLIWFPTQIDIQENHAELLIDRGRQRVNTRMLSLLMGEDTGAAGQLNELLAQLPPSPIDWDDVQQIADALHDSMPALDVRALTGYPAMLDDDAVTAERRRLKAGEEDLTIHSSCALALIPNSPDTRGVLTELKQIANRNAFSPPVAALLGGAATGRPTESERPLKRPHSAALSKAQTKALKSAARHPLTVLVGPPGTGKSYTIAAIALDHVLRGERVLIASKMAQPLAVIEQKIAELAGDSSFVVSGGKANYKKELCQYIEDILQGYGLTAPPPDSGYTEWSKANLSELLQQLDENQGHIEALERRLQERTDLELAWGAADTDKRKGVFRLIHRGFKLWQADRKLDPLNNYWGALAAYEDLLEKRQRDVVTALQYSIGAWRQLSLKSRRNDLRRLSRSLRARTHRKQEEWFDKIDHSILFRSFPIWMVPLANMAECLPLRKETFDLAIVDEATQCDMASALPVFQRAKRAVITGDPKQLRHISFLSRERQRLIGAQYGLSEDELEIHDFRGKSLLDLMNERIDSQKQIVLLDEHFRSRPPIIAFSNREFYRGALKIMTERPGESTAPAIVVRNAAGRREEGGRNPIEAEALAAELGEWMANEAELPRGACHSLGVLSPFRDQVECIQSLIAQRFSSAQIDKHNLIVGTAHGFQGEERDIMFLSFALDAGSHTASFRFLNRPDVFNVSITRAKTLQLVFTSLAGRKAPAGSLLARYLDATERASKPPRPAARRDAFLDEVANALTARGFQAWPAFPVAGQTIDLLVERDGSALGIDLIGHPGPYKDAFELERYRLFRRAGLRLFPLPWSAWKKNRENCLTAVANWVSSMSKQGNVRLPPG